MAEENIWVYTNSNIFALSMRQYISKSNVSHGFGVKLYNFRISEKLGCNTNIDFWVQPENLLFYANKTQKGFAIMQKYELKIKEDKFDHNGDISVYAGYDLKTKGYLPRNYNLSEDFSVYFGFKFNLSGF